MTDLGIHYIVAVKRGTSAVLVPESLSEYTGIFTFRERSVYYRTYEKDGSNYHLFYDMELANAETTDVVLRSQKKQGNA